MSKVIILCGKIASGKTYYAHKYKENHNAIILSVDDLMLSLSDSCLGIQHDDVAFRCENYFYHLAQELLKLELDVIIDFGYWLKKERVYAKEYFKERNILMEIHYIKVDDNKRIEQLHERNSLLDQQDNNKRVYYITDNLMKKLDNKFEEPTLDEIDIIWNGSSELITE